MLRLGLGLGLTSATRIAGPVWITTSLPAGVLNQQYDQEISARGGGPVTSITLVSGALPDGVVLHDHGDGTAHVTTDPGAGGGDQIGASGTFPITLRAGGPGGTRDQAFSLEVTTE